MALQSVRIFIAMACFCGLTAAHSQPVCYPVHASELLRSTAADVASLFNKSIPGGSFPVQQFSSIPQEGIVFYYDSTMTPGQHCNISGNSNRVVFAAAEDNGLCYGIYKYLYMLGFRFYLPGDNWEKIPALISPYKNIDTVLAGNLKYNNWNISGGHNRWVMDNDSSFGWDTYYGKNGHEWAKYQRRNSMNGNNRFEGHRGDVMTPDYIHTLQMNPCYVSCYNQSRLAGVQSTPDINNDAAKNHWAFAIKNQFTNYRNIITSNKILYANQFHNLGYTNGMVGIEVPDGAHWGNSATSGGCPSGNFNGAPYPKESDQQFLLANHTASSFLSSFPGLHLQCYAYGGHADTPGENVILNDHLDVQVIPGAFQNVSSSRGLLNRWYNRHTHISEYHYLNIPQWTGEAPLFSLKEFKETWHRIKERNTDGIVVEASPAKFASLPFLFSGNRYLQENIAVDSSVHELVNAMFPSNVAVHIQKLLDYFGNPNIATTGNFIPDNKFKLPLYISEMDKAFIAAKELQNSQLIFDRLREFKAYLHYLVLYYELISSPGTNINKPTRVAELCTFLARINRQQIVNSYYLIQSLVMNFPLTDSIYTRYNIVNGTAYLQGQLSLITPYEIDQAYSSDSSRYIKLVEGYSINDASQAISKLHDLNFISSDSIRVKIGYTNGYEYGNRSEFNFYAPQAGSISINYMPHFGMPEGRINLTVEREDGSLQILLDRTITPASIPGIIHVEVPAAGMYKLSVNSKFQSVAELKIATNGNVFFKNGPFYGNKVENYTADTTSFPKYFFVPAGVRKLYFSVNNACQQNTGCISASEVAAAFSIRDENNNSISAMVSPSDSSLFILNVPEGTDNHFWQVTKMREYNFCLANISNFEFFVTPTICNGIDFTAKVVNTNGECHTRFIAAEVVNIKGWEIKDGGRSFSFGSIPQVDLPVMLSPNATVSLKSSSNCITIKKISSIPGYMKAMTACASGGAFPSSGVIAAFPIPATSFITFKKGNLPVELSNIILYDVKGQVVYHVLKATSLNISTLPSGLYLISYLDNTTLGRMQLVKL